MYHCVVKPGSTKYTVMKTYYLTVVFVFFNIPAWTQIVLESDLSLAFEKAKSTQKELLVYVVDPECRKHPDRCLGQHQMDSLLQNPEFAKAINQNFLVYELSSASQKPDDKSLLSSIKYLYSPMFYFYSPNQERFAAFLLYGKVFAQPVIPQILDSVAKYRALIPQRKALNQKISKGQGTLQEIQHLMGINSKLGILDPTLYDHYLLQNGELEDGLMEEIGECECIEMDSPFFQTLLKAKSFSEIFFLRGMIHQQINMATSKKDSIRFERALDYLSQLNAYTEDGVGGVALLTPNKAERSDGELSARFNFAVATQNAKNIGFYAAQRIALLQKTFKQRKRDFISESAWASEGEEELNPDLPKVSKTEREARNNDDFNKGEAGVYNEIAWTIFENVQDKAILQKALSWAKTALKWDRSPEILDTYANLLFVLGKKAEAVQYQKEAIELLKHSYLEYRIPEYQKTLEKFLKG